MLCLVEWLFSITCRGPCSIYVYIVHIFRLATLIFLWYVNLDVLLNLDWLVDWNVPALAFRKLNVDVGILNQLRRTTVIVVLSERKIRCGCR